jgi:hypothetical protein
LLEFRIVKEDWFLGTFFRMQVAACKCIYLDLPYTTSHILNTA